MSKHPDGYRVAPGKWVDVPDFEAALDRYAAEACDMRDPERLQSLLKSYALMKGDSQLGCLLYQASRVISRMTTDLHAG